MGNLKPDEAQIERTRSLNALLCIVAVLVLLTLALLFYLSGMFHWQMLMYPVPSVEVEHLRNLTSLSYVTIAVKVCE